MPAIAMEIEQVVQRAFLTARLLTSNVVQAEGAVLEAIKKWNPDDNSADLFAGVVNAAVRNGIDWSLQADDSSQTSLAPELQAVLRLPAAMRRCFVLRILVGLPVATCASLLGLFSSLVDEQTSAALQHLALSGRANKGESSDWSDEWEKRPG